MPTRRHALALLAAPVLAPAVSRAQGGVFPQDRPIRAVVPFPPGGQVDVIARLLAPSLSERLGRTIIIDNRAGASGVTGAEAVARSAPDGHTLLIANSTHVVNPHVFPRIPYDTLGDFTPVGHVAGAPVLMAANPDSPFRTLADVLAAGRTGEGPNYGSAGIASGGHLFMALLQTVSGARFTHVPFRGGGPAIQAAMAGHVPLVIASTASLAPQVQSGVLRGIAVSGAERTSSLANIPTVAEQGFPGFSKDAWIGVFAPARTPDAAVMRINAALAEVLADPALQERMAFVGATARSMSPAEFGDYASREFERWGRVVRENGITME